MELTDSRFETISPILAVKCNIKPTGLKVLNVYRTSTGRSARAPTIIMDRAYEGDETRQPVRSLGSGPAVPPRAAAPGHGSTISRCAKNATRLKGFSEGQKGLGGSFQD